MSDIRSLNDKTDHIKKQVKELQSMVKIMCHRLDRQMELIEQLDAGYYRLQSRIEDLEKEKAKQ